MLKPSSTTLPICRLHSQRSPAHVAALSFLWVLSTACVLETAAPAWLIAVLTTASACYCWFCINSILKAEPFSLLFYADGRIELDSPFAHEEIIASNWLDFGYLKVLNGEINGRKTSFYWWLYGMCPEQRRVLWTIMSAWVKVLPRQPPSLTLNPLL